MTPADKCIQSLTPLGRADDPHSVELMQWYVASYVRDSGADKQSKIAALEALAQAVECQGWATQFAGHILAFIAQQRDGLAGE
jgi:hypothetical protein